jgi:hypothetical protein
MKARKEGTIDPNTTFHQYVKYRAKKITISTNQSPNSIYKDNWPRQWRKAEEAWQVVEAKQKEIEKRKKATKFKKTVRP